VHVRQARRARECASLGGAQGIASSSAGAKATIKRHSSALTYLSHLFIMMTPWIQISNTSLKVFCLFSHSSASSLTLVYTSTSP